jgi:AraC-like DNA-binding protein
MHADIAPPLLSPPAAAHPTELDLSPVYRHCVFRSAVRSRSHQLLTDSLIDHEVQWGRGSVDAAMFRADTPRVQVMVLRYGSEVEVKPRPFEDFSLVQMPLRGTMSVESGGEQLEVGPGQVAVLPSYRQLKLAWSEACEQIIVRMPHALMRGGVSQLKGFGSAPGALPGYLLDGSAARQWAVLLQSLLATVPGQEDGASPLRDPAWVHHMEDGMALFTLLHLRRWVEQSLPTSPAGKAGVRSLLGTSERLQAAERWVSTRLCAPLALEDLARAAGVSERTFYMECMRQTGVGPMTWLRDLRLDAARRKLLERTDRSVTDVAGDCGFGHLGRFSAYYQRRFGELPRETLSRAGR